MSTVKTMDKSETIRMIQYHAKNFANSECMKSTCGVDWRDLWTPSDEELCVYTKETLIAIFERSRSPWPLLKSDWQDAHMFTKDKDEVIKRFLDSGRKDIVEWEKPIDDYQALLAYLGPSTLGKYSAEV